jgi:hypothetical protein
VAAAVIAAAMRSSLWLSASTHHAFTRTNYKHVPSRPLWQSCDKCWNLATIVQGGKKDMVKCPDTLTLKQIYLLWFNQNGHLAKGDKIDRGGVQRWQRSDGTIPRSSNEKLFVS